MPAVQGQGRRVAEETEEGEMRIEWREHRISDDRTVSAYHADRLLGDIEHWPDDGEWVLANFGNELDGTARETLGSAKIAVVRHYRR